MCKKSKLLNTYYLSYILRGEIMVNALPKWVMVRYSKLWNEFKDKEFTFDKAVKVLKDKEAVVSVFLSDLRKAGWIQVNLSQKDLRQRVYKLKSPAEAIKDMNK